MELLNINEEARDYLGHSNFQEMEMLDTHGQWNSEPHWSSYTMDILSSMPSRTIGRSRGAIISQYYNRTMRLRRHRQTRPSLRDFPHCSRPSIRGYGGVETGLADTREEETKRNHLVNNLQNLNDSDCVRMLKTMPLNLAEKSQLRHLARRKDVHSKPGRNIPCCSQLKCYLIIVARQAWYSWLSLLSSLQLWKTTLKAVSGRFGTGVLSYFVFLRTLLFFNLLLFIMMGMLLVLPQSLFSSQHNNTTHMSGLEFLTGGGLFADSVMFYGYYTNGTLEKECTSEDDISMSARDQKNSCGGLNYNMPLAYFFTVGFGFFVTGLILVYTMSKLFRQSFRIDKSQSILAMKVFCSWDFKVIKKTSVKLQCENISTQLKELLAEVSLQKEKVSMSQWLAQISLHLVIWVLCIGAIILCDTAVYYFSDHMHKDLKLGLPNENPSENPLLKESKLLALPVVVSALNLILPALFNIMSSVEKYNSPNVYNWVAISRNLMLKVSVLGILCYHWLGRIAADPESLHLECWETFVGQELYRFLMMDFIFTLLGVFFGEFLWRFFTKMILKRERRPAFDIAQNVLELIYGQTLAWIGVLFTPLIPAVQIMKLIILFYLKKASLMINCQVPLKPWRASQMTTIFITLLCFPSFLGATVCVTSTMWSLKPSKACGPFRDLQTMIQSGKTWVKRLENANANLTWLTWFHTYLVENPVIFLFLVTVIVFIVIYFNTQKVHGQREIITLLQEQIENEGEDKKFLITKLQQAHEESSLSPNIFRH